MKIDKLKLIDEVEKDTIVFDEVMQSDGKWSKCNVKSDHKKIVEVPYDSYDWTYYLATRDDEDFTFFRVRR